MGNVVRDPKQSEYISAAQFAKIVGISRVNAAKVAAAARVRIRAIPGAPTKYHAGDAQAIAADSFRVAGEDSSASRSNNSTVTARIA